jgi:acyl dehydratase
MRVFSDFSEFKSAIGIEIGASEWIEITQDRIDRFADATCDEQWIHVDQDRARKELPGERPSRTDFSPSALHRCLYAPRWVSRGCETP